MAKASITLVCKDCGETFRHEKFCRNRSDANDYENWAESHITQCPSCYKKEMREIQREQDLKALEGVELVSLEGSEKQIKWAEDIRRRTVADCMKHDPSDKFFEIVNGLKAAKWWIDHRYDIGSAISFFNTIEREGLLNG